MDFSDFKSGIFILLIWALKELYARFQQEESSSKDQISELRSLSATIQSSVFELRVLVDRLDLDVKELWRLRGDVNNAWNKIRDLDSRSTFSGESEN